MLLNFFIKNVARRGVQVQVRQVARSHTRALLIPVCTNIQRRTTPACQFHKTPPRGAFPPALVLLIRYMVKGAAMLSGRFIRKWWSRLSPEEKEKVLDQIRSRKSKIAFAGSLFAGLLGFFYLEHIIVDPVTKRRKFMILSQNQIYQLGEHEYMQQRKMYAFSIIPPMHPLHRRVLRVANTLVLSNSQMNEIRDKMWSVTVIDRPDITNAFVLPHGKIFVFTGMLNLCTNDDQLAIVLSHEMAHSILSHVAESMSKIFFVEFILLVPTMIFWTIFPDFWAIFSDWLLSSLAKIFIHLPFSRAIEMEADVVGMQLAAKSCYDVREAPVFWQKMKVLGRDSKVEWLSTHPSHEMRQMELQGMLPEALRIRSMNNCPSLGSKIRYW